MSRPVTRDMTVAVFVTSGGRGGPVTSGASPGEEGEARVLLHEHARLGRWLPPGGHIEPGELPDEAARREVREETGLAVTLVGEQVDIPSLPGQARQLCRPAGVQVVEISSGHEHVDLVYLARAGPGAAPTTGRWLTRAELDEPELRLTAEVRAWCLWALEAAEASDGLGAKQPTGPAASTVLDVGPGSP